MLAPRTRAAIRIAAVLYLALGLVLFAAPAYAASVFPWTVSPLAAMTIGGWALGNGVGAWLTGGRGPAGRALPMLLYLVVFAAGQLLVVIAFRSALKLDALLAIPYLLTLAFTLVAAAFGALEVRSADDIVVEEDARISPRVRQALGGLAIFTALLGVAGFIAGDGGLSTTGEIFPEPLTLFTVRAFAAFYVALAVGIGALVLRPSMASSLVFGLFGTALIVAIVVAAVAHLSAFDFSGRPLGILYLGAYVVVFAPSIVFLWRHRSEMPTA